MKMSDHPEYIDPEQFCSPARRNVLKLHAAYYWCCQQVARPVIAVLNFFDETPRFAAELRRRQEEDRRALQIRQPHGRIYS